MTSQTTVADTTSPSYWVRQGWCGNAQARNERGDHVPAESPDAVRWCLLGAIEKAVGSGANGWAYEQEVRRLLGVTWLGRWNDHSYRKQAEVIEVLEKAELRVETRRSEPEPYTRFQEGTDYDHNS